MATVEFGPEVIVYADRWQDRPANPEIKAFRGRWAQAEQAMRDANAAQRQVEVEMDQYNLARKPSYPTQAQRDGLAEAARRIRAAIKPSSHHGDSCNSPEFPAAVVVDGQRGWLNIRHGAPYGQARKGGHLWRFTDEDVWTFALILWENDLRVVDFWHCDGGVSIRVAAR
jgi:hypothetical protein